MSDTIEVDGKQYGVDEEGYLANLNDWVPGIATVMAAQDNIELTDEHWDIINFLREYYEEYQIAPAVRVLTKRSARSSARTRATASISTACSPMDRPSRHAVSPASRSRPAASDPSAVTGGGLFASSPPGDSPIH